MLLLFDVMSVPFASKTKPAVATERTGNPFPPAMSPWTMSAKCYSQRIMNVDGAPARAFVLLIHVLAKHMYVWFWP